jgi:hypothetical protein
MATISNGRTRTPAPVGAPGRTAAAAQPGKAGALKKAGTAGKPEKKKGKSATTTAGAARTGNGAATSQAKDTVAKPGKKQRAERGGKAAQDAGKTKVVRDSFTMPDWDYEKLAELKRRCLNGGVHVKKSELLRAGLKMLESLPERQLLAVVAQVETVKTGRPARRKAHEEVAGQ